RISRVHRHGGDHGDNVPRWLQRPRQRPRLDGRLDLHVLVFYQAGVHDRAQHLDPWHVAAGARRPVAGICLESPPADVDRQHRCGGHVALSDVPALGVGGDDLVARSLVHHTFETGRHGRCRAPNVSLRLLIAMEAIFWILSAITVLGALFAITLRNLIHCVLSLILFFLGIAGHYFLLRADFLGAVQILIYIGAVAVLMLFAIM